MIKSNKTYLVELNLLQSGDNLFNYTINNTFFEQFEFGEIQAGDFEVEVNLLKSTARTQIHININGYAVASCDKCIADIELKLNDNFSYTLRTLSKEMLTEDVLQEAEFITISKDEMVLDLSPIIYENIHLLLPMQRLGCTDRKGIKRCDESVLAHITGVSDEDEESTEEDITTPIDPRWAALLKLKK